MEYNPVNLRPSHWYRFSPSNSEEPQNPPPVKVNCLNEIHRVSNAFDVSNYDYSLQYATSSVYVKNELSENDQNEDNHQPVSVQLWPVKVSLEMKCLWDEFNELGTEMIVTKAGR